MEDHEKVRELKCNTKGSAQSNEVKSRNEMVKRTYSTSEENGSNPKKKAIDPLSMRNGNLIEMNPKNSFTRMEKEIEQVLLEFVQDEQIDYTHCCDDNDTPPLPLPLLSPLPPSCIDDIQINANTDSDDSNKSHNVNVKNFNGRMFGHKECCSFQIELFSFYNIGSSNESDHDSDSDSDHDNDSGKKIAMEIRRMSGDGFVFNLFFSLFMKEMIQKKLVENAPHSNLSTVLDIDYDFAFNPFAFLPDLDEDEKEEAFRCMFVLFYSSILLCVLFFFCKNNAYVVCAFVRNT
ncbi:hypothetical protein RFI_00248, partial [Reticulomyxa filosa]